MTQALLGTSFGVFLGITALLTGFAAFMTGQAIANTWRLFDGALWSWSGYLIGSGVLVLIGTFAFRLTRARKMVVQYPWLYKRTGLFSAKPKGLEK
jgi:hypothetical protein